MTSPFTRPITSMTTYVTAATTVFLDAQNISDDYPALEIFHDLETKPYRFNKNSRNNMELAQHIMHAILRWTDMLNCHMKVGAPCTLDSRF